MSLSRALLIVMTSSFLSWSFISYAYSEVSIPNMPITALELRQADSVSFLMTLSERTGIPIGIEVVGQSNGRQNYTVTQSTLGAELDSFIQADPRYKWKQLGKAVNVFPANELESVFDIQVASFHVKDSLPTDSLAELLKVQVVSSYLSRKGTKPVIWSVGSASPARFTVDVEKVSLREAIDQIVVSAHANGWTAFHQLRGGNDYLYFQIR